MKILLTIIVLVISFEANSQVKHKHPESFAASAILMSTAVTVHFMDTPVSYYGNDHLMNIRYRQRATVAITGMATTTITYFVVKNIRHKVRRNKVFKHCKI